MTDAGRKIKGRSPRYPGISLDLALDRAKTLWDREAHHPTNVATVLEHWGYKPKSGGGMVALAALISFGLLEDSGSGASRTVKLTDLAKVIILNPDRDEVLAAVRQAALTPTAHQHLWERYAAKLPSDQSLRYHLVTDQGFTEVGATEFVREYKRTFVFARLADGAANVSPPSDEPDRPDQDVSLDAHVEPKMTPPAVLEESSSADAPVAVARSSRTVHVTYSPTEWALLQAKFPMTEQDWNAMIAVLEAMKRGLVSD